MKRDEKFYKLTLYISRPMSSSKFAHLHVTTQTAIKAIPSFNWPGSKMPPSPLEAIFGGGAKKVAAPPAPPAPVKKASPFAAFGKKAEVAAAAAPAKGKVVAKAAAKVVAKVVAKPAAKAVAKPAAKGAVAGKKVAAPAAAPKKSGLFGFGGK